jgi:phage terminase large subunit GpA-like protein
MSIAAELEPLRVRLPSVTRAAIARIAQLGLESLRALPPMKGADWAAKHFKLMGESSHQRGGWEAWPFQVGILDMMADDDIFELDVFKSKRVGYTKMLVADMAFKAAYRRRNQALWQPTDDDRDSFVKSEVDPLLDTLPALSAAKRLSKAEDTIKLKQFRDCLLHLLGGKAARAYRRITVADAKLDELDAFDQQIEKSGDPFTLAAGRLEGAPFPKIICGSTPRIKGLSHMEHRANLAEASMRFHVVCRHCGVEHPMLWGGKKVPYGFKWDTDQPETARHVCPHCLQAITQAEFLANQSGAWVCEKTGRRYGLDRTWRTADGQPCPAPRHVVVYVWSIYSPQRDWPDIARECMAARRKQMAGDTGPMQGFVNETRGETWEIDGDRADEHALQKRAEGFPLCIVPVGGLMLTAGGDLQGNRCEIGVWAWGKGLESWPVDHHVLEMNPQSDEDWDAVAVYLLRRYKQAWREGSSLGIDAISFDANYQTQAVLNFVRRQQMRMRIFAVRGEGEPTKPIKGPGTSQDVTWRGQKWPNGVKLWAVGVKAAKDLLHGQLQISQAGPGYVHFSNELQREWYEQLTAEQRIQVKTPTGLQERWVKRRPRNEVLDTRVYAAHAAYMLGMNTWPDRKWSEVEQTVQPPADLFSQASAQSDQVAVSIQSPAAVVPSPGRSWSSLASGRAW